MKENRYIACITIPAVGLSFSSGKLAFSRFAATNKCDWIE